MPLWFVFDVKAETQTVTLYCSQQKGIISI